MRGSGTSQPIEFDTTFCASAARNVGGMVVWTFDPPAGDTLVVSMDGLIQMNAHFGAAAVVSVFEGDRPVASLHYRTWTAP